MERFLMFSRCSIGAGQAGGPGVTREFFQAWAGGRVVATSWLCWHGLCLGPGIGQRAFVSGCLAQLPGW